MSRKGKEKKESQGQREKEGLRATGLELLKSQGSMESGYLRERPRRLAGRLQIHHWYKTLLLQK